MPAIVDIPLNTMLADLDAALRRLLKAELARHGFGAANVVFEAPTRDWAATLSAPTVSLFLYDLCEAAGHRTVEWQPQRVNGGLREQRPPLRFEASYAVTAFTQGVEDEHRLLSQVIGILYAHPALPCGSAVGHAAERLRRRPAGDRGGAGARGTARRVLVGDRRPVQALRGLQRRRPVPVRAVGRARRSGQVAACCARAGRGRRGRGSRPGLKGRQAELSEVQPGR